MYDEFPHTVNIKEEKSVPNGSGGSTKKWVKTSELDCFMDTPSTSRKVEMKQLVESFHRDIYFSYEDSISLTARIEYEGVEYTAAGDAEDQGGMHEVMRLPLKKV
ncbi:phage head closure protein [Lysinibacillus sp. FW12]|uniref:phage head closure protein n=1 Tax=Lysinibacillus sp. FW12 TaxID=3096079 RepID=UPI003D71B840